MKFKIKEIVSTFYGNGIFLETIFGTLILILILDLKSILELPT